MDMRIKFPVYELLEEVPNLQQSVVRIGSRLRYLLQRWLINKDEQEEQEAGELLPSQAQRNKESLWRPKPPRGQSLKKSRAQSSFNEASPLAGAGQWEPEGGEPFEVFAQGSAAWGSEWGDLGAQMEDKNICLLIGRCSTVWPPPECATWPLGLLSLVSSPEHSVCLLTPEMFLTLAMWWQVMAFGRSRNSSLGKGLKGGRKKTETNQKCPKDEGWLML
jgi:hypothetical protein